MADPITLEAKSENLPEVLQIVSEAASRCGFSDDRSNEMQVAAEEAFVNIVHYAYEDTGDCTVDCTANGDTLTLTLSDSGVPFDPVAAPPPDTESDVADRPIGGLGIFLVKKFMDDVSYRREGDRNILCMKAGPGTDGGDSS